MPSPHPNRPQPHALLWLALAWVLGFPVATCAQLNVDLVSFAHPWRYNQSGVDLGTSWRAPGYNDSTWPAGSALFGVDPSQPFPYAQVGFAAPATPLDIVPPAGTTDTITYYFRTRFDYPSTVTNGVTLTLTGYVDDGCLIYLNGSPLGSIRMPAVGVNWQTLATSASPEGDPAVLTLPATNLVSGTNILAVEVHQSSFSANVDVAFALHLKAAIPQPLTFTNPPAHRTNVMGTSSTFAAGVAGGPAQFQWLKNGTPVAGGATSIYTIASVDLSHAGAYSVRASNQLGTIESDPAQLVVLPDNTGPRLLGGIVVESGASNTIVVYVSERLNSVSAANTANYVVTLDGTTNRVPVEAAISSGGTAPAFSLRVGTNHWRLGSNYLVTVRDLKDQFGNVIAPDSQVLATWPRHRMLLEPTAEWDFHAAAVFDPAVYLEDWTGPDYVPGPWWARGTGPFCGGPLSEIPCLGMPRTETGFQPEPILFRVPFQWPADLTNQVTLRVAWNVEDGGVLFLNGALLTNYNVALPPTPIAAWSRALTDLATSCLSNSIPGVTLRPGTNWLTAALLSTRVGLESVSAFGCTLQADYYDRVASQEAAPAVLRLQPSSNAVTVSWTGAGYTLETATRLAPGVPWREVTNMANPFLHPLDSGERYFRLRK